MSQKGFSPILIIILVFILLAGISAVLVFTGIIKIPDLPPFAPPPAATNAPASNTLEITKPDNLSSTASAQTPISLKTQYSNPFDENNTYSNPFDNTQNPFETLK